MGRPRFHGGRLVQFLIDRGGVIKDNDPGQCRVQMPDGKEAIVHHNEANMGFIMAEFVLDEVLGIPSQEFAAYLEGK
jgi:hypothetical protein